MDMAKQRKLTPGEIALARAAFGDKIDYKRVTLCDGPGMEPLAHMAFARGNPAITVESAVYFKQDYCPDFAAAALKGKKSFIHEMTHVWQYQKLGLPAFALRYGAELVRARGKPNDMYKYEEGKTKFTGAMLEAQADMVGDYSEAVWGKKAGRIALLGKNMAGSGLYGL
jgi:hypothetical protein